MPDLDHHPIRDLVAAGVTVTINTDDPPMFGTDLNNEYAIAARLLDLDERGVADLATDGGRRVLCQPRNQGRMRAEISSYAATPAP